MSKEISATSIAPDAKFSDLSFGPVYEALMSGVGVIVDDAIEASETRAEKTLSESLESFEKRFNTRIDALEEKLLAVDRRGDEDVSVALKELAVLRFGLEKYAGVSMREIQREYEATQ